MIKSIGSTMKPMRRNVSESISPPDWFGSWCMGSVQIQTATAWQHHSPCPAFFSRLHMLRLQEV
jgi:hypothetical protein